MVLSTLAWSKVSDCQTKLATGKGVLIDSKVYCVGIDDTIHCYNPSQDNWTILPSPPVRDFSLGQVNGELVAVGGACADRQKLPSDAIYTHVHMLSN